MGINMKNTFLGTSLMVCGLLCGDAIAAPTRATGYIDLEQVRKDNPVPTVDINKTQQEAATILDQVSTPDIPKLPEGVQKRIELGQIEMPPQKIPDYLKNDKTMKQQQLSGLDLEKIAQKYNDALLIEKSKKKQGPNQDANDFEAGRAYLFVSSSMPKQTLENLLNEAGRLNIAVFLKGNIGDDPLKFMGTQKFMNTMKIKTPPELFIHPDAFQMFKIERVPALVVAASDVKDRLDEQGCAAPDDYDIISGDLKLSANIAQIYEKATSPDIKDIARYYLKYSSAVPQ